jgi:hypothetical protein
VETSQARHGGLLKRHRGAGEAQRAKRWLQIHAAHVADTQNNRIRWIKFGEATIETVAGGGNGCAANTNPPYDGCPATDAVLDHPAGVASGSLIGADTGNEMVRAIDPDYGQPVGRFSGTTGCAKGPRLLRHGAVDLASASYSTGAHRTAAGIRRRDEADHRRRGADDSGSGVFSHWE